MLQNDPLTGIKGWVQTGEWAAAIVAGLVAAFKAITEMRRSNDQRREDMRWKRAEKAEECLKSLFSDKQARAAMKMLDWDGLRYEIPGLGRSLSITHERRRNALRTTDTDFTEDDNESPYIRDCFDALLDGLESLEHYITIGLIEFQDVERPLAYYVEKLAHPDEYLVIQPFLDNYGFQEAERFLNRYQAWTRIARPGEIS